MAKIERVGILTGGGDAPGLNAVIRRVVLRGLDYGWKMIPIYDGWKGLTNKGLVGISKAVELTKERVEEIRGEGGTILYSSRTNPYKKKEEDVEQLKNNFRTLGLNALIAIGGEDTLGVAKRLNEEGIPVVGVPKTIDNDLSGTDYTFGFDTAWNIAGELIGNLHTTAKSHHRVLVVEVMGRHAGWITSYAAKKGKADITYICEVPIDLGRGCEIIEQRYAKLDMGEHYAIVAVSEGASLPNEGLVSQKVNEDAAFGHVGLGGIAERLANAIKEKTGKESRHVVLGHLQRAGPPTETDIIRAETFASYAVELVKEGRFGYMSRVKDGIFGWVPLGEAVGTLKKVPLELYDKENLRPSERLIL